MKVITGPRQSGRTTEAIRLANEHDANLVVHSKQHATRIYHSDTYPDLEKFPITYQELESNHRARQQRVVIDDLDMFLRHQFDVPIEAVTMTTSETIDCSQ